MKEWVLAVGVCLFLSLPRPAASQDVSSATAQTFPASSASYLAPIIDIVTFDLLINRYGRYAVDRKTYQVSFTSIKRNLQGPWVVDNDPFSTNQLLHPYQGSMYHAFARSAGLDYWRATAYTFGGSLLWEIAGETTPPSKNDQIASGIGGSFLGEPLFRVAQVVLGSSGRPPGFWRQFLATAISPATGVDRVARGDRVEIHRLRDAPSVATRVELGAMAMTSSRGGGTFSNPEAVSDFSVDYKVPGRAASGDRRPFDDFSLEFRASTADRLESVFSRGVLAGRGFGDPAGAHTGLVGLYGSYDYVSPKPFRVSTTALSLGATTLHRLSSSTTWEASVLAGVGYGAGGMIDPVAKRDFHYGLTPQALVTTRFVAFDRAAFDVTLRDYYVSDVASTEPRGSEQLTRGEAAMTMRMFGGHAGSIKYLWSRRGASYPGVARSVESQGSIGVFYTYLGGRRFGVAAPQRLRP